MTREEAINELNEELIGINPNSLGREEIQRWAVALDMAIKALKEQRPRGEWKPYKDSDYCDDGYLLCTKCNWRFSFGAYRILQDDNYCPHCGAYMRKESQDDRE